MNIVIVGGGICGLSLALNLNRRGIACSVSEIKPLGVGITLLPHAMREFSALGLGDALLAAGIENRESCFFNRFGQLIYKEPRGKLAGYNVPEVGIHRGRLHVILAEAVRNRIGPNAIRTDHECTGVEQAEAGATVHFKDPSRGRMRESVRADVVIACDGINSAIRKQYYPNDKLAFAGINSWRGVTRRKPIFDGRTYIRAGSILTGKMVIYPTIDNVDGQGNQLINWMADIQRDTFEQNDWNRPGQLSHFLPFYESWRFDWLDAAQKIRDSELILEYPMVDKDPIEAWTFGRMTLAGDAAHPMYPRGSNGAAQAVIDARTSPMPYAAIATRARRLRPMRQHAAPSPPRWCVPIASTHWISSIQKSRSWSATSRSTISICTLLRANCAPVGQLQARRRFRARRCCAWAFHLTSADIAKAYREAEPMGAISPVGPCRRSAAMPRYVGCWHSAESTCTAITATGIWVQLPRLRGCPLISPDPFTHFCRTSEEVAPDLCPC